MATESVAIAPEANPSMYGAEPIHGNYTEEAETHLWCARALSILVSSPDTPLERLNDDAQAALRYLLSREIARAQQAHAAGA